MHQGFRLVAAGAAIAMGAAVVTACSVIGIEQQEPITCEGESPPATAPGESFPLLTVAQGESPWALVTVVYADGVVVQAENGSSVVEPVTESAGESPDDSADSPGSAGPDDSAGPWRTGYLLPCAVSELREVAERALFGGPEFGRIDRPDLDWTYLRYDNGVSTASAEVHGHGTGFSDGLSWSERRARDVLREVSDLLRVNIVSTGEAVPVAAVQLDGEIPDGAALPSTWPGPPAAEVLGEDGCGVLPEDVAEETFRYGAEQGLGDAGAALNLRVLPPGVAGCE